MQDGKTLAFYSRKLNSAQTRYTTGKQELLIIVETLKEFRDIVLGQQDALSRLEKDEDEKISETEEGLVLSHTMCAVEQNEARVMPETK
jgi:hypothetical protein